MEIVLYALTALLYGRLTLIAWRSRRPLAEGVISEMDVRPARLSTAERSWLLFALIVHGVLLDRTIFPLDAMVFGFAFALSAMLWLGAGAFWVESFFFPIDGLRLLILPLACAASVLPLIFGGVRLLPYAADPLFKLHFLIANVAYGLLALAALHAVLMLLVERRLHAIGGAAAHSQKWEDEHPLANSRDGHWTGLGDARHPYRSRRRLRFLLDFANPFLFRLISARYRLKTSTGSWLDTLPPLLTLEKLLFRLIIAGFVLLTLTLVSGIWFSEQLLARAVTFDHKTVFSVLSWLMFGALLVGRRLYGWRGRTALRWVLAAFIALLLAYVGSRFVFEVVLHRLII